ncbi:MAG: aldehyde ferredoxin oxidoreductase N-terminal domain-containing protein, partial [Desulfovibrionaceae bacterium]
MSAKEFCGGWTGRVLLVDLSQSRCEVRDADPDVLRSRLGGRGLGGWFLRPACSLAWDDPDMPVSLCAGPLVGTLSPTSGRSHFTTRSPLTGAMGDSSVGGKLGTQLKRAGLDAVVVTGRSEMPCGLEIENGAARIVAAGELAGMRTSQVFARLAGFGSVACIGPAAENRASLACVSVDKHHAAGRTGLGLALAAKNLKYFAVTGSGRVAVADKQGLLAAREEIMRLTMASPVLMGQQGIGCFGTGSLYDLMDARRMMPTDNFQRTCFERASELNAFAYRRKYAPEKHGCKGCHVLCKKVSQGRAMPEFEVMSHFTALIGNADLDLVVRAGIICNDLGLDAVSAGSALACLREVRGRDFGPGEVVELLESMGRGQGALAHGARAVAQEAGLPG